MIIEATKDGFKVLADIVPAPTSFGEDTIPRLIEIRDAAGDLVGKFQLDLFKLSFVQFEDLIEHVLDLMP